MTYPTTLPSFTRPLSTDTLADPGAGAFEVVDFMMDEIEGIATNLGLPASPGSGTLYELVKSTSLGHDHDGVDSKTVFVPNHDHSGDSGDGATFSHANLTSVTVDQHHTEQHSIGGASHTGIETLAQMGEEFSYLTSTFTRNNDAETDPVTGLDFDVVASGIYIAQFLLWGTATDTADFRLSLTGPASPTTLRYQIIGQNVGATAGGAVNQQQQQAVATAYSTELRTGGQNSEMREYRIDVFLANGTNSGTVALEAAQWNAEVSDTKIEIGSYVMAKKVG